MIFRESIKNQIWTRLGTRSRRALMRMRKKQGNFKKYCPRSDLINNLSYELKLPPFVIANHLMEMRDEFLKSVKL